MQDATSFALADLQLDQTTRRAQRDGRRLDLTVKEFALLSLLLRRQGQILSRAVLGDQVGHELRQRHPCGLRSRVV